MSESRSLWAGASAATLLVFAAASPAGPAAPTGDADFEAQVRPFLQQHCERCHGEAKQKGGLRLNALSTDFGQGAGLGPWLEVIDKLGAGEMPPMSVLERPDPEESLRVARWLSARIEEGAALRAARRELVSFHRLTREEYAHSVHDLLGVRFDPSELLEDDRWRGFERVGSVQSMSAAHVEVYLDAAEGILEEAYPDERPVPFVEVAAAPELLGPSLNSSALEEKGIEERLRADLWPGQSLHRRPHGGRIEHAGVYRVRVRASGVVSQDGRVPHLVVQAESLDRLLFEADVLASEAEPVVFEFEAHLPAGRHIISLANGVPGSPILERLGRSGRAPFVSLEQGRIPWQVQLQHDDGSLVEPLLLVDSVEWEGPLPPDAGGARARYLPRDVDDEGELRACLTRFAERAFRRPLAPGEIEPFARLVRTEREAGSAQRAALRTGMAAVLCSQNFLYLKEGSPDEDRGTLDGWELAARLSHFLWSTMPDGDLRDAAQDGSLLRPEVLREQTTRLLADPRSTRFAASFARQWLELDRLGRFPPDNELYPDYDDNLERSMRRETTGFFAEVLERNLDLRELLVCDWTLVNARLARHYGLDGIRGDHMRRVPLDPSRHRSGLLTQAAVLSLTSDGTRHRPVHRGVWLAGVLFDEVPPPPPANIEPIEPVPARAEKATVRMQLEDHIADAGCAACHARTDPLGFAFENYDAIGRWRTREHVPSGLGDDPPVDASGTLVDGRSFEGAGELQALLVEDLDRFHGALTRKLATYALRRAMTVDDRAALDGIVEASAARGGGLRDLVEALVDSKLFRSR